MHTRPAIVSERPQLIDLQRRSALANPGDHDFLLMHPELIDTPTKAFEDGNVLVAERDTVRLGFAALAKRDDGDMDLEGLFVEPDHWHCGIGRRLVAAASAHARERGATELHAIGNLHAEGFYDKLGFRNLGRCALDFGTGLMLALPLARTKE